MTATEQKPVETVVRVLVFRALLFPNPQKMLKMPNGESAYSDAPENWFEIQPKHTPQDIPNWVMETEMYKQAKNSGLIVELLMDANSPTPTGPQRSGAGILADQFPPLACETAKFVDKRVDGRYLGASALPNRA